MYLHTYDAFFVMMLTLSRESCNFITLAEVNILVFFLNVDFLFSPQNNSSIAHSSLQLVLCLFLKVSTNSCCSPLFHLINSSLSFFFLWIPPTFAIFCPQ